MDRDRARNPQRNDFRAVERECDDMAHLPRGDRARNSGHRLAPPMDAFAKKFRWRGLRHRVGRNHACPCGRPRRSRTIHSQTWSDRTRSSAIRIYTSDQAHSSAEKAAIALGVGEESVCRVSSDKEFRMDTSILRESVAHDRESGFKPLAVVATVGTTSTASVDPVAEIARLCREERMWLHIDGAYGGGFTIVPEYEWIAEGWSKADSIMINPHKTIFLPLHFNVL